MELSDGQELALKQLKRIANVPKAALRIDHIEDQETEDRILRVDISIDCTHYEKNAGGLKLHDRESFRVWIDNDFPWKLPEVRTPHTRFRGFRHVQWGNYLCLYLSIESQWDPSRGMYGYVDQLNDWLKKAAINKLDAEEGPLHPPVAYTASNTTVYIQKNTPKREEWPWIGAALYKELKPNLISITDWKEIEEIENDQVFAPVVLLNSEISFEFPALVKEIFQWLELKGVDNNLVIVCLMKAAKRLVVGQPLRIAIGVPARGIVAEKENRLQHISIWEISADDAQKLKMTALACDVLNEAKETKAQTDLRKLVDPIFAAFSDWQTNSLIGWCQVVENRPEIVIRRDKGSNVDWFCDKCIAIWGCGALGSHVAEHLVRAGARKLVLSDRDKVNPGILVRQNFVSDDFNENKVDALKRRLLAINPNLVIEEKLGDILDYIKDINSGTDGIELLIDTTASLRVRAKLELVLKGQTREIPIASMMISGEAKHGMLTISPAEFSGGPYDVIRRLGLAAKNRDWLDSWVDAFWRRESSELTRQPEPGCSDSTFVGSNVDVASLVSRMLNALASNLATKKIDATGMLVSQDTTLKNDEIFHFAPDIVVSNNNVDFRLSQNAWRDTRAWISAGKRERSAQHETGGLLFGQYDESLQIGWITSVSGPPVDSTFLPSGFVCGTAGTEQLCKEQKKRSLDAVQYIGTWHSHPVSEANPSETDFSGIASLFENNQDQGAYQHMMIVGFSSSEKIEIGLYGFEKSEVVKSIDVDKFPYSKVYGAKIFAPVLKPYKHRIGLSLSGGGSRAIAFHLGTLRALEDTGLLDHVDAVSGVSGGAVMTGLLGYTNAPFMDVDSKTVSLLKSGLVMPAIKKFCNPKRFLPTFFYFLIATIPSAVLDFIVALLKKIFSSIGIRSTGEKIFKCIHWPIRRRYSRTHVMADAIASVTSEKKCNAPTRDKKTIIFNACELRTGTAFRMSNHRYGSWRFGWAEASKLRIADAITASAAFPALLPAYDWIKTFTKNNVQNRVRILVTDGGVYENLGISALEPGRNSNFNVIDYQPEVLIASDADTGQFSGEEMPGHWAGRMAQVMDAVMRKVQDATKGRLHAFTKDGHLKAFVYANLGQIDDKIAMRPSAWIPREEVIDYPTDFSAMSTNDLKALAGRGDAITRALITRYLLSD